MKFILTAVCAVAVAVYVAPAAAQCVGDANGNNMISIGENVQVVNNFLNGCQRFKDNGDGTVTDNDTGLMWEKKTDDGSIHDRDNAYTWSTAGSGAEGEDPDGTAFTTFLATLNGGVTGVGNCTSNSGGATQNYGFAGHCDWRLPTIVELQTILLEPPPCSTSPCIDEAIFGPTAPNVYWSSSTVAGFPDYAWFVYFNNGGFSSNDNKTYDRRVRAVRGGL